MKRILTPLRAAMVAAPTQAERIEREAKETNVTYISLAKREATRAMMEGNRPPKVGDHVWMNETNKDCRCIYEAPRYFSHEYMCGEELPELRKSIARIDCVKYMSDEEALNYNWFDGGSVPEGFFDNGFTGGGCVMDEQLYDCDYSGAFTLCAAIITPSGRWYLVDPEGYDYGRYLGAPINWREMWPEMVAYDDEYRAKKAAQKAEEERKEQEAKAKAQAEVNRWKGILTDIRGLDWKEEKKTIKANMMALLKHTFKGTKFTASAYGGAYTIHWTDGPTESEVEKAVACFTSKSFCGYDDSTEYYHTAWIETYGGIGWSADVERTLSPTISDRVWKKIESVCSGTKVRDVYGDVTVPFTIDLYTLIDDVSNYSHSNYVRTNTDEHKCCISMTFCPMSVYRLLAAHEVI